MSHDIADDSRWPGGCPQRLVIAGWVEREFADQGAVRVHDADVLVRDEQRDRLMSVDDAEADVMEAAQVSQGNPAVFVDVIVPDAVVGGRLRERDCTRLRVLRIYDRLNQKTAIQFID